MKKWINLILGIVLLYGGGINFYNLNKLQDMSSIYTYLSLATILLGILLVVKGIKGIKNKSSSATFFTPADKTAFAVIAVVVFIISLPVILLVMIFHN